jgi:predicted transcriptional regulator
MPPNVVKTAEQERLWNKAKVQAEKQGRANDYAYIMGIFKQMGAMDKSLVKGMTGIIHSPADVRQFHRRRREPGQVPGRSQEERAIMRMAREKPKPWSVDRMTDVPRTSPQRVVDGLGMDVAQASSYEKFLEDTRGAPNEVAFRRSIMGKMIDDNLDPSLRRELFKRSLQYHRFRKSMFILEKADPKGGKYHRRVQGKGGRYRYYYDEDQYKRSKDAHVDGKEAANTAIEKAIATRLDETGEQGCKLDELKKLVKQYGADHVGSVCKTMAGAGKMKFKKGVLYKGK